MTARYQRLAAACAALLAVAVPGLTSCGDDGPAHAACGRAIGFLGSAPTGRFTEGSTDLLGGMRTALAAYNKKHPTCRVRLVVGDTHGRPAAARKAAGQLIEDDRVVGVVGPDISTVGEATGSAFAKAGLATISPSATSTALARHRWRTFFRVVANDDAQGPAAGRYVTQVMAARHVFVIDDAETYGTGLAHAVTEEIGRRAAGTASIHQGQSDFADTVAALRNAGADGVYFAGFDREAGLLLRQLRAAGWTGVFAAGDAALSRTFLRTAGPAAAEGAVLTAPAAPSTLDFTSAFQAANHGRKPGPYAAEAADATRVLLAALGAGDGSREDVLAFVRSYDAPGVTRRIRFTSDGEVATQTIYAYLVRDGRIQPGWEIQ